MGTSRYYPQAIFVAVLNRQVSENQSAHLNASEEQLQVSSLQFLVTNTSLVGLSECGNIEP